MSDFITVDRPTFLRMSAALVRVEDFFKQVDLETTSRTWVSESETLSLMGCKKSKLYELKKVGVIKYRRIGKRNEYSRKSINKYIEKN
jgi:hypothetical protein